MPEEAAAQRNKRRATQNRNGSTPRQQSVLQRAAPRQCRADGGGELTVLVGFQSHHSSLKSLLRLHFAGFFRFSVGFLPCPVIVTAVLSHHYAGVCLYYPRFLYSVLSLLSTTVGCQSYLSRCFDRMLTRYACFPSYQCLLLACFHPVLRRLFVSVCQYRGSALAVTRSRECHLCPEYQCKVGAPGACRAFPPGDSRPPAGAAHQSGHSPDTPVPERRAPRG
ncbi:hypothetical protein Tchar_00942 [Tepidimonas charontis]|uniref:Uncharacterized protein n=1 Tax=Tepidimonas charontis TaxID=2267262 RepID=A0A554XH53_9BURK|nr:hypothetical protein Tchar_00942 [Tepidimonas charontis]